MVFKKAGDNTIWLDIETGGINPAESSILSAAWGETGKVKTRFAAPTEGSLLSEFSEKNIIPQLQKAVQSGQDLLEEKKLIETLITELEQNRGAAIAGFNIRGFDFGYIQRRARIYGLEARFTSALAGRNYIDPVHHVKGIIATSIMEHAESGLFNQQIGASSWAEAKTKWAETPLRKRPIEFNLVSSIEGYIKAGRDRAQFKGWKLEDINKLLELHSGKSTLSGGGIAHEAASDLVMTRRVIDAAKSGELKQALGKPEIALEWMKNTKARGFHQLGAGAKILTQSDIAAMNLLPGKAESKLIKSNWKIGLGLTAGAIIAANIFTASDDNYNTIEGLPHGNFAQSKRLEMTPFGSGWRGIAEDPTITKFREEVWSDPEQKSSIKKLIAEEQAAAQEELGSFEESDYTVMSGNFKTSSAKAVAKINLDNFNITAEDADTLILKRKGLLNFFDNPIQVRMAGIDAPEVGSHGSDPLSIIRYAQEQPFGKEATSRLQEIIEEAKSLSLYITGEKTYGRYVGALNFNGDKSVAETLLSEGMVTALPFGKEESDLLNRKTLDRAQETAKQSGAGLWSLARYQFMDQVNSSLQNPITHNTLTRLDKLAEGYALAAYTSKLESFGNSTEQLTSEDFYQSKGIGRALAAYFKPRMSGKDDAHNTIEGLGHKGIAWQHRQAMTEFGSGYKPKLTLAHIKELAARASTSSVSDFFRFIKVSRPNEVLQPMMNQTGGGLSIDLKQLKRLHSFQPKSLLGFNRVIEEGQARFSYQTWRQQQADLIKSKIRTGSFVSYDAAEQISEATGISLPKNFDAIDDINKIIGFHEAAELQNIRSIPTSILKSEMSSGGTPPSHAMSVVQEELFSRSLHPEARNFMKQIRKVTDSWFSGYDDTYNTNEGLRHGGLSEPLRKLLTEFGSGWQGPASLRRAERLYKSIIKSTLSEAGHKGKINWMSHIDEDTGEMVLAARNAAGERLMGVQRTFTKESVDLTSIEVDPSLRGGIGRKFYEFENRALKRLGLEGAEVTSPVANPVTGRMQAELYGSKPMSLFNKDIEEAYGVGPDEFQEMLMSKRMTKDQWEVFGLAPTFSGKVSAPKNRPIMSGKDDAHNTIEGLGHKGIAQKLRKLLTPFGSGWRGLIKLSNKIDLGDFKGASGAVATVEQFQKVWKSNVDNLKAIHAKDWWKTEAGRETHKLGKNLIQAREAGFSHVAAINTDIIAANAQKSGNSFGSMLKHTIEHEKVHLGLRLEGTQVGANLPVPTGFKTELMKNPVYRKSSQSRIAEEYVANLSAVMKYPERARKDDRVRSAIMGATAEEVGRADALSREIAKKLKIQRKKNMTAFNQKKALGQTWQAGIDAGRRSKMG